jgi:uncharacterized membrane protein YdjX (TVP38/TMEM64 family)
LRARLLLQEVVRVTERVVEREGEPKGAPTALGRILRLLPLAVILLALVVVLASGIWRHLSLDELRAQRVMLKAFVRGHPVQSVLIYITAFCAVVALSIPGALLMTLAGGFLFGTAVGGCAAVAGVSSGAVVMFLAAHTAVGDMIRKHAAPDSLVRKLDEGVARHAFLYILSLRLMPAMPIWLVNVGAAFVKTPVWTYALATVLGVMPSTFIYASVGSTLDHVFAAGGRPTLKTLLQAQVLGPLFALGALALTPIAYQLWSQRRGRRAALPK